MLSNLFYWNFLTVHPSLSFPHYSQVRYKGRTVNFVTGARNTTFNLPSVLWFPIFPVQTRSRFKLIVEDFEHCFRLKLCIIRA